MLSKALYELSRTLISVPNTSNDISLGRNGAWDVSWFIDLILVRLIWLRPLVSLAARSTASQAAIAVPGASGLAFRSWNGGLLGRSERTTGRKLVTKGLL